MDWKGSHSSRTWSGWEFFLLTHLSWNWDGTGLFLWEQGGTGVKIHSCVTLIHILLISEQLTLYTGSGII